MTMYNEVKKRLTNLRNQIRKIGDEADYIDEDLIDEVMDSEDLVSIEMALDNIALWANNAKDYVRCTYDEFE